MEKIKKQIKKGLIDSSHDDPFEVFVSSTNVRFSYYKESHKILGNTFGMCVLQDFEALTPNLLARTIETVEGGGLVVILLKSVTSLKQLYTMTMVRVYHKFASMKFMKCEKKGCSCKVQERRPGDSEQIQREIHTFTWKLFSLYGSG